MDFLFIKTMRTALYGARQRVLYPIPPQASSEDFEYRRLAVPAFARLRGYGVTMSLTEEQMQTAGDALAGKSIVISGVFAHHSREEYKVMIEQYGGKNVGSISGKTSFILAGENMGPSKLQKAEKLGVPIVSEDEFLNMLNLSSSEE